MHGTFDGTFRLDALRQEACERSHSTEGVHDDRVARRADDAWSRIKPEDPAKQPADVRVACGAFVRKGGRQQPLTLGKRSVEAPTPAPKKMKTPIPKCSLQRSAPRNRPIRKAMKMPSVMASW